MLRAAPQLRTLPFYGASAVRPSRQARTVRSMGSSGGKPADLSDGCKGAPAAPGSKLPLMADESIMAPKAHGTATAPVQNALRWSCDPKLADRICWCGHPATPSERILLYAVATNHPVAFSLFNG